MFNILSASDHNIQLKTLQEVMKLKDMGHNQHFVVESLKNRTKTSELIAQLEDKYCFMKHLYSVSVGCNVLCCNVNVNLQCKLYFLIYRDCSVCKLVNHFFGAPVNQPVV